MHVIPAIDIQGGQCVRLYQGDFSRRTVYDHAPAELASSLEARGFRFLHVVDLDGAKSGEQANRDLVRTIAENSGLSVQLGGGIRDQQRIENWLQAGVDRCIIGSQAVSNPSLVRQWLQRYGSERIVLALDVRLDPDGTPWLMTHGWTRNSATSLWQCVDQYLEAGLQQVLCTDVERDGAMRGPNLDLYRQFLCRYPALQLQASGGVRDGADLDALQQLGASAAITGRSLLDGRISDEEIRKFLPAA